MKQQSLAILSTVEGLHKFRKISETKLAAAGGIPFKARLYNMPLMGMTTCIHWCE